MNDTNQNRDFDNKENDVSQNDCQPAQDNTAFGQPTDPPVTDNTTTPPPSYNFGMDFRTGNFEDDRGTGSYYYDYTKSKGEKKKKRSIVFPLISLIISLIALGLAVVLIVLAMRSGNLPILPSTDSDPSAEITEQTQEIPDGSLTEGPVKTPTTIVYNDDTDWINNGNIVSEDSIVNATYQTVDTVVAITISMDSYYGSAQGAGSGVVIGEETDENGKAIASYIITNHHVVNGAKGIRVTLTNGDTLDATLVGSDTQTDIAVIKVKAVGLRIAKLGNSNDILLGETVIAIGNPLGEFANTVSNGIISGLERDITIEGTSMKLLQTNAAVNPGNSGGGLFNLNGELIGVVNAKSTGEAVEGIGFAIPVNTAKQIAEDLIKNGYVSGRSQIGVSGYEITSDNYNYYREDDIYQYIYDYYYANNKKVLTGFYITEDNNVVYAEKDGEKFKFGDIIAAIDGIKVSDGASVAAALTTCEVGKTIPVSVYRLVETETNKFGQTFKTTQIKTFDIMVVLGESKG